MRKLMWAAMGFGAACALGIYLLPLWFLLLCGAAALLAAALLFAVNVKGTFYPCLQCICFGFFLASVWYLLFSVTFLSGAKAMDGQTQSVSLQLTDYSYETDYGIGAEGVLVQDGSRYKVKFYLNEVCDLAPGDMVLGEFRFRYTGYGGLEDPTHHSADRIFLLAYPVGEHTVQPTQQPQWRYLAACLRRVLTERLELVMPQDILGFMKALLMGDTSELSYSLDTDLKISGIRHIAAVSGLHVSVLFSLIYVVAGKQGRLTVLLGVPVLVLFAAMAGFSPSVTRACLMQGLMLMASVFRKEYDPPTALAFAALTMMVANPVVVTDVGFQLSVASVAGIFLFAGRIHRWFLQEKRFGRWKKHRFYGVLQKIATSIAVSLGALLLTTPLTAWYFGTVSLLGVLTNLLCLWLVTGIFCAGLLSCLLGALWLPAGKFVGWLLAWVVRVVMGVAGWMAELPLAAVYTDSIYIVAWLVFCYGLLTVFLFGRDKRPGVLLCCAVLGLCVALLASWTEPLLDHYRVTVLDVGQGQCVLLQSGGRTYMVDCGGDYEEDTADRAAATLLSQGVARLDGLILSHYDKDHVGAAAYLLSRIPTDLLILPEVTGEDVFESEILRNFDGQYLRGTEDLSICWGDAEITVYASHDIQSSNESSLCVLFHTEKCDILITGDRSQTGEEFLLRSQQLPQLDALIVGHHGSGHSTGDALLAATCPTTAVISVGANNRYNHPAQTVLDRLISYGCRIRRTDLEGTILLRG